MKNCEQCQFYDYDEVADDYYCTADMDEDDYARFMEKNTAECPFFRFQDEYRTARKQ